MTLLRIKAGNPVYAKNISLTCCTSSCSKRCESGLPNPRGFASTATSPASIALFVAIIFKSLGRDGNNNLALLRELDGIVQQIHQHLMQTRGITYN